MSKIFLKWFGGMRPRQGDQHLIQQRLEETGIFRGATNPDREINQGIHATEAENCNLFSGELRPIKQPALAYQFCRPDEDCWRAPIPDDPSIPPEPPPEPPSCTPVVITGQTPITTLPPECNPYACDAMDIEWAAIANSVGGVSARTLESDITAVGQGASYQNGEILGSVYDLTAPTGKWDIFRTKNLEDFSRAETNFRPADWCGITDKAQEHLDGNNLCQSVSRYLDNGTNTSGWKGCTETVSFALVARCGTNGNSGNGIFSACYYNDGDIRIGQSFADVWGSQTISWDYHTGIMEYQYLSPGNVSSDPYWDTYIRGFSPAINDFISGTENGGTINAPYVFIGCTIERTESPRTITINFYNSQGVNVGSIGPITESFRGTPLANYTDQEWAFNRTQLETDTYNSWGVNFGSLRGAINRGLPMQCAYVWAAPVVASSDTFKELGVAWERNYTTYTIPGSCPNT